MKIKIIIDEFGRELEIDEETRKLYSFSNKDRKVVYNAEIVEKGEHTGFFTNYTQYGTVDDLSEKLKTWNNKILLTYAKMVGFKSSENDPDNVIYNKLVDMVKANEDKFFTKEGDFRKKFLVSDSEILKMI